MSLSDERRRIERAESVDRIVTPVSLLPPADQTYVNVSRQIVALKKSDGKSAEELKPMVMSAVVESGNEGALVCGYISRSLEVTAAVSFCDITLNQLADTAKKSFMRSAYGGSSHPEAKRIRERLKALSRDIVDQIVVDTVIEKEGAALSYLRGLKKHLENDHAIVREIDALVHQLETVSRRIEQSFGRHL